MPSTRPPRLAAILALAFLPGCTLAQLAASNRFQARETLEQTWDVEGTPRVVVGTFNGAIRVEVAEGSGVAATITKEAHGATQQEADANLAHVALAVAEEPGAIRIEASRGPGAPRFANLGAEATLRVPPGTRLELTSSNGEVAIAGPTGDATARTSNGPVRVVRAAKGPEDIGAVRRLVLHTSNGPIEVDVPFALVEAETSNGAITFAGALRKGDHRFETSNGSVRLTLPPDAGFALDARTSNGSIDCGFKVENRSGEGDRHLAGDVGCVCDTSVAVKTSNGNVEIRPAKE